MTAIGFELPDETMDVRDGVLAFAEKEVLPRHREHRELFENRRRLYTEDGRLCDHAVSLIREVRMASAEAGYFNMCVPESLGGGGLGMLAYYVAWEALYRSCGPHNWLMMYVVSHWALGPSRILEHLTPEAKERVLAPMMRGETCMSFGLSEPGAGSDAAALSTRATAEGAGWLINGRKIWNTMGPIADYTLLFAITDMERARTRKGGISAFIVPTDTPGYSVERVIRMFGNIGGDEAEIVFEDMPVEAWQLVGELDQGFATALYGVSIGRLYNSARAVGTGRWALELALEHIKTRKSFDRRLSEYQGVTFPLAECATELHGAHLMGLNSAILLDKGEKAIKELSMCKAFSVERGVKAIDQAMQTFGAMGFTNEMGLTEAWQHIRTVNVADGTNEIMRRTIAHRLLSGDVEL